MVVSEAFVAEERGKGGVWKRIGNEESFGGGGRTKSRAEDEDEGDAGTRRGDAARVHEVGGRSGGDGKTDCHAETDAEHHLAPADDVVHARADHGRDPAWKWMLEVVFGGVGEVC